MVDSLGTLSLAQPQLAGEGRMTRDVPCLRPPDAVWWPDSGRAGSSRSGVMTVLASLQQKRRPGLPSVYVRGMSRRVSRSSAPAASTANPEIVEVSGRLTATVRQPMMPSVGTSLVPWARSRVSAEALAIA